MNNTRTIAVAVIVALACSTSAWAKCFACKDGCDRCRGPYCVGKSDIVDVEKHCWKIECEDVCIPAVRFPWECGGSKLTLFSLFKGKKGCGKAGCCDAGCDGGCGSDCCNGTGCVVCVPPKCGFVRRIHDLKKETYTCTECEYSLELVDAPCGNCGACDAGVPPAVQPTATPQPKVPTLAAPQLHGLRVRNTPPPSGPLQVRNRPQPPEPATAKKQPAFKSRLGLLQAAFGRNKP